MAKKVKLDTTKFKQFVLEKGERVGLGVALAIMVLLAGFGLLKGLSASSPAGDITKKSEELKRMIANARPPADDVKNGNERVKAPDIGWTPHYEMFATAGDWFDPGAAGDTRRRNPDVLRVGDVLADGAVKNVFVKYIQGGVRRFSYDPNQQVLRTVKPSGTGGAPAAAANTPGVSDSFARELHPTRMVLVTATFPIRDQIEAVRKALRLNSLLEVQAEQAEPKFLGLLVYRREILPDGKATEPIAIYDKDDKDHPVAKLPETQLLLTTADYDEAATKPFEAYLKPGLATPLPKFVVISGEVEPEYPKIELAGIKPAEDESGTPKPAPRSGGPLGRARGPIGARPSVRPAAGVPNSGGGGALRPGPGLPTLNRPMVPGANPTDDNRPNLTDGPSMPLGKVPEVALVSKLKGEFNIFDATGGPLPPDPDYNAQPMQLPPGGGFAPSKDAKNTEPDRLLVRFFDADVQPGKTYQYEIHVRMANPNYGASKKEKVAFPELAEMKDIWSEPTVTPPITIPQEYFVYVVDTPGKLLDKESKALGDNGTDRRPVSYEKAAIQIHRWADTVRDGSQNYVVADWIIAERLLIHRGEKLERAAVEVELAKWDKYRGTGGEFDLASSGGSSKGKVGSRKRDVATVDFYSPDRSKADVLIDFDGGKRPYPLGSASAVTDDSALELLVLHADGKLGVRSGREDTDPETPTGRERAERYTAWRERISSLRPVDQSKMPNTPP
jgi:hypothetical protein